MILAMPKQLNPSDDARHIARALYGEGTKSSAVWDKGAVPYLEEVIDGAKAGLVVELTSVLHELRRIREAVEKLADRE